jgi:hypothetical protein
MRLHEQLAIRQTAINEFVQRHVADDETYQVFQDEVRLGMFRYMRYAASDVWLTEIAFDLALLNETPLAPRRPVYHLRYRFVNGHEYGFILHLNEISQINYTERKDPWIDGQWLNNVRL